MSNRILFGSLRKHATTILRQHQQKSARTFAASQAAPTLDISAACVNRLSKLQAQRQKNVALRVTVDGGGCSGFQYGFHLEDATTSGSAAKDTDDIVIDKAGVRIITDRISLNYLHGSTLHYEEEMMSSSFRIINNPNSESSCGCGVSFSPKQ